MRGGDDAHIGLDRRAAADGGVFAFLQHAQQARLRLGRHVADLVEEQRAAGGLLELAGRALHGAGEGAALVAEQLALDQLARDRRHVERHERSFATLAVVVQRARHQLLAGARFARDHDREVGRHQPGQRAVDLLHGRRTADQRQALALLRRLRSALHRRRRRRQRAVHDRDQLVQVERLGQIFEGAALGGAHRGEQRRLRAHDDDAQIGPELADARHEVEAVLVGHHHVGDDELALAFLDPLPQRRGRARAADIVALPAQRLVQDGADRPVVVGDQDGVAALMNGPDEAATAT